MTVIPFVSMRYGDTTREGSQFRQYLKEEVEEAAAAAAEEDRKTVKRVHVASARGRRLKDIAPIEVEN